MSDLYLYLCFFLMQYILRYYIQIYQGTLDTRCGRRLLWRHLQAQVAALTIHLIHATLCNNIPQLSFDWLAIGEGKTAPPPPQVLDGGP